MRQSTKFYAVLLCAALGFSTSIQSCKDYDDDIDGLQEQIDAVNKSIESLKKDFGALAYVKDVKWDESTRTLTITPATGNPVTYKIEDADTQDGNTKYTLTSSKEGNKITITLKGDDSSEQKVEFELPSADSITKNDITLNEEGFICVKGEPTSVQMPQGFDFAKMEVVNEGGKLYLKYGDTKKELTAISQFDPAALTFESDDKGNIIVKYLGEPTGQTIKLPETAIVEKEDGSGFIIKIGDKQVEIVNLNILKAELKSLVFIPELYYQGIKAMSANTFFYKPLTLKAVTADGRHADDASVVSDKELSVTPTLKAQYHLNPSNAAVSKENLSFIFDNKPYTKAGEMEVTVKDAKVENGVLTVFAGLANGTIKDITNDEEVSTLALQAVTASGEKGDTTITSDYAAIKAVALRDFALAEPTDPDMVAGDWHHFTTAKAAIENTDEKHIYSLLWNDEDGIDVAELIQTHVGIKEDIYFHRMLDVDATTDEIKAYGFKYNYELVGYISGANQTSQSAHAAMKGSKLRAQFTKDGKQQPWQDKGLQNRTTIGRMPLVRVTLIDTTSNNVVSVAYLKFRIVEEQSENKATVINPLVFNQNYTANCKGEDIKLPMTWDWFEENILAHADINMSKEDFHYSYGLDGWIADQFDKPTIDAERLPADQRIGRVELTWSDNQADQTKVLTWTIKDEEAYKQFLKGDEFSVIVRFSKAMANYTYHYVYVTLTWKPTELNVKPTGTIDNGIKFSKVWFKHDTKENGFDDVHFGVAVPTSEDGKGECTFTNDLLDKFSERKLIISGIDAIYEDFADELLTKTFTFVTEPNKEVKGCDGKTYILTADKTDLIATEKGKPANKEVIAKLRGENGKVLNSIVTYQEGTIAKAILNKAYETVDGALTAKVAVNAVNGCGKPVTLSNNEFFVKFMRPISINKEGDKFLEDGVAGGSELKIADILSFIDWRDNAFTEKNDLFNYYKVNAIELNTDAIKISDGGLLTTVYPNAKIEFVAAEKLDLGNLGKLTWKNLDGTVIKEMTLIVPVEVEYAWGTITKDIEVKVKKTQGN